MRRKEKGDHLLAEALAEALDRDLADVPSGEQLRKEYRFSTTFEKRMERLLANENKGKRKNETVTDARAWGAKAKQYVGVAAALVCVIGLVAVAEIFQSGAGKKSQSAADTAAPEMSAVTEEVCEDAVEDQTASGIGESDTEWETGFQEDDTGGVPVEETDEDQKVTAPGWQEKLLLESAKADELVTWHLSSIDGDGSIVLLSRRTDGVESEEPSFYVSGVFEVYDETAPDEWECIYRAARTREDYEGVSEWTECYTPEELHITKGGTYRFVRQVNSFRQVLQLTLEER